MNNMGFKTVIIVCLLIALHINGQDVVIKWWHNGKEELTRQRRSVQDNVVKTSNADLGLNMIKPETENDISHLTLGNEGRHATEITAKITRPDGAAVELKLNKISSMNYNISTLELRNGQLIQEEKATDKENSLFLDKNTGSVFLMECDDTQCKPCAAIYDDTEGYVLDSFGTTKYSNLTRSDKGRTRHLAENPRVIGIGYDGKPLGIPLTARKRREIILDRNMIKHLLRRKKRSTETLHVVELIMVADYSEYKFWLERSGNNATDAKMAMELYFILLANMMDLRFESIYEKTGYIDIKFMINAIIIAETPADSAWITNNPIDPDGASNMVNVAKALDEFTLWVSSVKGYFPPHDHVMAISRSDLAAFWNGAWDSNNLGSAWKGTMCSVPQYSTSIIEDAGLGLVDLVAAHELGHSLSSEHDVDGCDDDHVMSEILESPGQGSESNPYELSDCTVLAVEQHLNSLSSNCLQTSYYDRTLFTAYKSYVAPGVFLPVDTQCELAYGVGSRRCDAISPSICSDGTYCWHLDDPNACYILFVREGTACGRDMRCQRGKCQNSTIETITCPPKPSEMLAMSSADATETPAYTTVLPGDKTPKYSTTASYPREEDFYC